MNLAHALPHNDTSTEFHTESGPFTLVPLPGQRSSLVWVDRPDEVARRLDADEAALAAEIEARSSSLLGAITIDGPRQAFPLSGMTATGFAASRAVLVGEAAHLFPPIGAQGLNLGYRDVAALGEILPGPGGDPGAPARLAAYERARRGRRAVAEPPPSMPSTGRCSPASCRSRRSAASACSCSTGSRRSARRSCGRASPRRRRASRSVERVERQLAGEDQRSPHAVTVTTEAAVPSRIAVTDWSR